MILTTMILIIAALAVVVIGFVMDRLAIRKIKGGMKTLNRRLKELEKMRYLDIDPSDITLELTEKGREYLRKMEEVNYEAVDPEQEEDVDSTPADQADGEV